MKILQNYLLKSISGLLVILVLFISHSPIYAQDDYKEYDIVVEIEGMVCPFCSHSLEADLNKMEQIKEADVSFLDGLAKLVLAKDQQVTKEQLTGLITNGYKAENYIKFPDSLLINAADTSDFKIE